MPIEHLLPPSRRRARARRRPSFRGFVAALVVASSLVAPAARVASADGTPPPPPPPLGDLTFYGRGYGHGVGMSQYGARGRALAGQTAADILAHYYQGTAVGTVSTTTNVRVLLLTGFKGTVAKPLAIKGLGRWTIDGVASQFPPGARLTLAPTAAGATTWTLKVFAPTGEVLFTKVAKTTVTVRSVSIGGTIQLTSKATATNVYRGMLRVRLSKTAQVINHVPLDRYLWGVVPLEMPSSWPVEALKAQAVAARSYAVSHLHPTYGSWDVYDDTRSQVYRGRKAETTTGRAAVAGTAGQVLTSGSTVISALFHSADGGATENNENVYTSSTGAIVAGPMPYLRGMDDRAPDGTSYDAASPYATWKTATYPAATLGEMLALDPRTNVGDLTAIGLTNRGVSGRLISVTLTGSLGTKTVSGEVFRSVFNAKKPATDPQLRSTLFDIAPIP
ncbi:MAG TPA: SpoIID/LytB domain-containing protein [Candidatus Limnocylindrales bacterium]|nr:SpoIID/LytB domain-containing protein [Candidatus Limnocylindrales bacterium]